MLRDYILQCGSECTVMRNNNNVLLSEAHLFDAIVISPGPQTPEKAGHLLPLLTCVMEKKPILGICLGHQAIGVSLGARLDKAFQPKHGKVEHVYHTGDPLFNAIPSPFSATRYHSLILSNLPENLHAISHTQSGEIMGIKHQLLPVWGVQFHPESCMTPHGLTLIRNFLNIVKTG